MFYDFPLIKNISQVEEAIKGREEFVIKHDPFHGTKAVNYRVNFEDTFPKVDIQDEKESIRRAILRECRGLIFDDKTGNIMSRRLQKFFNADERDETKSNIVQAALLNSSAHWLLKKLDGSMITSLPLRSGIRWGTKMGVTDVAAPVEEFVRHRHNYKVFAEEMAHANMTPIFEWCSRQQKIVVDYPEDKLVLTAVRHNRSGEYLRYDTEMKALQGKYDIPLVDVMPGSAFDLQAFVSFIRDLEGEEGAIIRFDNGHMVKIKGLWYCQLHKTKELMNFEKDIWALCLNEKSDDAKAFMDDEGKEALDSFNRDLFREIKKKAEILEWQVIAAKDNLNGSKKRFALEYMSANRIPSEDQGLLYAIWDGKDPVSVVTEYLKSNIGTQTKVDNTRKMVGKIKWSNYYGPKNLDM